VSPRTWTTAELVTAALLNTNIRDNMNVLNPGGWTFGIDGGGAVLTSGSKMWTEMPFAACLQTVTMVTAEASTLELGLVKNTYANWGSAPSPLYGSSPLNSASSQKAQITTLTTWAPSLAQGDWIGACVIGCSGITFAAVGVRFNRN